jgi:predicted DNA-binding transcriptional regulator YafY
MRESVTPLDDGTCEYRPSDDSLDWLAMRVGMIGVDFEVHEPPELVETLRALIGRLERATRLTMDLDAGGVSF